MPVFEDICYGFDDSVLYCNFPEGGSAEIREIMLCSYSLRSTSTSSIYIGTPQTIDYMLTTWKGRDALNLLVAECTDTKPYKSLENPNLNIVVSSAPLADLHNALMANLNDYNEWHERLSSVSVREGSIGTLLATAVSLFEQQISLYLLSPTFHIIDYRSVPISPESMLLNVKGDRPLTDLQSSFLIENSQVNKSTNYLTEPILENNELKGYLLIIHNEDTFIPKSFVRLVTQLIPLHAYKSFTTVTKQTQTLTNLLTDILLFDPKDVQPLYNRLADLPYAMHPCIRMLIITHDPNHHITMGVIESLASIFPECNIAPYDRYIIVLLSGDDFLFRPSYDEEKFERFLEKLGSYAIFTASVRFIRGLRIFFKQAENILSLLENTNINGGKRHAFLDDLFEYTRVHTCISALKATKDRGKLVYLFHPFIVQLMRYDDTNDTDFLSFAFAFARNNGSITQTANRANYHRNTIYNKINRINEIFGIDLNDDAILRELVFAEHAIQIANAEGYESENFIIYSENRFPETH